MFVVFRSIFCKLEANFAENVCTQSFQSPIAYKNPATKEQGYAERRGTRNMRSSIGGLLELDM